ncbi:MAG: hypothetical protein HZA90_22870 [Verrucomicrobia bacterium]|nr:hypothetical protein [Verrucomicrobiota bacterium]
MNRRVAVILVALAVMAAALGFIFFRDSGPRGSVSVTLRIAVTPTEQAGFVVKQANSARFKYEISQKAGLNPVLAQKLSARTFPNSSITEVKLGVETKDQAQRYAEAFVAVLQAQCGPEVQLSLVHRTPP